MSKLAGAPYFLQPKSQINTRVRAVNAVGISESSDAPSNEIILEGLPAVMGTPRLGDRTDTKLTVCWDRSELVASDGVDFHWGINPRTPDCVDAACGLDNKVTQTDNSQNCHTIAVNPNVQ